MIEFSLNGEVASSQSEGETPLLWVLREELKLTGTKFGCGIAQCGACTVHLDGNPARACVTPVQAGAGGSVTSSEGLATRVGDALKTAWESEQVPQCGYCQPGMIMAVSGMLNASPDADDAQIDSQITNICRCGTFQRVREGVHLAKEVAKKSKGETA